MTIFKRIATISFIFFQLTACSNSKEVGKSMITKDFEFTSGDNKLSGIIDQPENGDSKAIIVFIHGSGPTDIRMNNRYIDLRRRFTALGITCVSWDKPGNGRSEGQYNPNQTVEESAQEVLDAVAYLRSEKIAGFKKFIIWSGSRGGWVAPIALSKDPNIKFWISVAGVPAEDNKYYILKSNLPLEGHSQQETKVLMRELIRGKKVFMQGGNYDEYLNVTENLRKDSSVSYFAGDLTGTKEDYEAEQKAYMEFKDQYEFDKETLSILRIRNFDKMLSSLNIDVLALHGEKDTNVDWRKTKQLYESTIGKNPNATLVTHTFKNANHNMSITKTGSIREVEGVLARSGNKAEGYYEIQLDWLRKKVLAE